MKHPGGRPTKYDPKFIKEVDKYLIAVDPEDEAHYIENHLPKLSSFAIWLNVNHETLTEWAKKYPEFSASLNKITNKQLERLIDDGLYGNANPTIAKLILSANHGMRERTDLTTNDKDIPQPIYGSKSTSTE